MSKLAGQILTTRGVTAFWLSWCAAFVLMLWAVSPGRTLKDALAAEPDFRDLVLAALYTGARYGELCRLRVADFNPDAIPGIAATLATLAAGAWIDAGEPVVLLGDSGTGKSHLLIGLGLAACEQGRRVRYATTAKLVNELAEAATTGSCPASPSGPTSRSANGEPCSPTPASSQPSSTASPATPTSSRPAPSPTGSPPARPPADPPKPADRRRPRPCPA